MLMQRPLWQLAALSHSLMSKRKRDSQTDSERGRVKEREKGKEKETERERQDGGFQVNT